MNTEKPQALKEAVIWTVMLVTAEGHAVSSSKEWRGRVKIDFSLAKFVQRAVQTLV